MQRSLSGFASMRQFVSGLPTGLCGAVAILGAMRARPSVTAKGYDLSPQGLRTLYSYLRRHTYADPYQGTRLLCDPDGAMNIWGIHAACTAIASGTHTLIDYAHCNDEVFTTTIRAEAGIRAIIVEYSNGQALTSDEQGLHYHFNCVGGIDTQRPTEGLDGGYATCDGDSHNNAIPARANPPIWHARPTLLDAVPVALVICA